MKTFNCKKCGLKFKAKPIKKGESRMHLYEEVKCPRCGSKIEIRTDKDYGESDD